MNIHELIDKAQHKHQLFAINIRGANGSGKSSLARKFLEGQVVEVEVPGLKKQPGLTYSVKYNTLLIGRYHTACGGCDTLVKAQIVPLLKLAWMTDCNLVFEGVLVSDSKEPYFWLMKELNDTIKPRHWGFVYLELSLEICLARIQQRNGGKVIKTELVAAKHRNMIRYKAWQLAQGYGFVVGLDAEQSTDDMFLELLKMTKDL